MNRIKTATIETTDDKVIQINDIDLLKKALGVITEFPTVREFFEIQKSRTMLIYSDGYYKRIILHFINCFEKHIGPETRVNSINKNVAFGFLTETLQRSKYLARQFLFAGRSLHKDFPALYNLKNPFEGLILPKIQHPGIVTIPNEDFDKILDQVDSETIKEIFICLAGTGCRRAELLALRKKDYDPVENLLQIGSELFQTKTKKIRYIPLKKSVKEIIERRITKLKTGNDFIFKNPNGYCYSGDYVTHQWIKAVKAAGVGKQYKLKSLRSTFGSKILQAGNSIEVTAELLGNSIEVCAKHYAKLNNENLKKAIQTIEEKYEKRSNASNAQLQKN